jgi:hypothetical protein
MQRAIDSYDDVMIEGGRRFARAYLVSMCATTEVRSAADGGARHPFKNSSETPCINSLDWSRTALLATGYAGRASKKSSRRQTLTQCSRRGRQRPCCSSTRPKKGPPHALANGYIATTWRTR